MQIHFGRQFKRILKQAAQRGKVLIQSNMTSKLNSFKYFLACWCIFRYDKLRVILSFIYPQVFKARLEGFCH